VVVVAAVAVPVAAAAVVDAAATKLCSTRTSASG